MKTVFAINLVIFGALAGSTSGNGSDFNIDIKQPDAEVYHEQSSNNSEFNYGYQVEKVNSQFQHKVKGPDDVTYGCYGYIDPGNEKHLVYYVADRLGYRVVAPNQPAKIFTDRVSNSINKLNEDLSGRTLDSKVVAWNDLYLPDSCRKLDEILTITPAPVNIKTNANSGSGNFGGPLLPAANSISATTVPSARPVTHTPAPPAVPVTYTPAPPSKPIIYTPAPPTKTTIYTPVHPAEIVSHTPSPPARVIPSASEPTAPSNTQGSTVIRGPSAPVTPLPAVITTAATAAWTSHPTTRVTPWSTLPNNIRTTSSAPKSNPITAPAPIPYNNAHNNVVSRIQTSGCDHQPAPNPTQQVPNLGPFNGYVYPIHGDCGASAYNVKQLLTQMEALNAQVLELSANIRTLQQAASLTGDGGCQRSWLDRQQFPLLVYVPILIPYIDNAVPNSVPPNSASGAFRRMCEACK